MQQKKTSQQTATFFLVGLPGAGKTYWGKILAAANNIFFIDLDKAIEDNTGLTIAEIFAAKGETVFREIEAGLLQSLLQQANTTIIATGGGTPCFFSNIQKMNEAGITIWLDEKIETIAQRINNEEGLRPMFMKQDTRSLLLTLLHDRKDFYSQCKYRLQNINVKSLQEIINHYV